MNHNAEKIVTQAIMHNDFEKLILGEGEYHFSPFYSPTDGHDLTLIHDELSKRAKGNKQIAVQMNAAIMKMIDRYECLVSIAICILCEALGKSKYNTNIGLPLEEISNSLARSIVFYKETLIQDKSGPGSQFDDGMYGELKRISNNTQKYGGPDFC